MLEVKLTEEGVFVGTHKVSMNWLQADSRGTTPAWRLFVNEMLQANHMIVPVGMEHWNKRLAQTLGCRPSFLLPFVQKLLFKHHVVPVIHLRKYFTGYKGSIHMRSFTDTIKHRALIEQALKDGQENIIPFIRDTGLSPKELKLQVGKGAWKRLCSFSYSRNKKIAAAFSHNIMQHLISHDLPNYQSAVDVPTTMLKHGWIATHAHIKSHYTTWYKGKWGCTKTFNENYRFCLDTYNLLEQLGKESSYNPLWSPRRMKEEHDAAVAEINKAKYSPEKFPSVAAMPQHLAYPEGELEAVLLDSPLALAEEGTKQGHCVASYGRAIAEGSYLVYSVRKRGGDVLSTLGLSLQKNGYVVENQHKGKYNARVTCPHQLSFAQEVLREVSKTLGNIPVGGSYSLSVA